MDCTRSRCSKTTASPQLQTVERPRRPSRVDTSGRGGGGYEASTRDVSRCCNRARSCARCRPWRLVLRWLPLEAVKASNWHRVYLGDTDELVGGLIGSEGVLSTVAEAGRRYRLWPPHAEVGRSGRVPRRLVRGGRERPWWSKCEQQQQQQQQQHSERVLSRSSGLIGVLERYPRSLADLSG